MSILKINYQNIRSKLFPVVINDFDLQAISEMLHNGLSFIKIMELIESKHNKEIFIKIKEQLEKGIDVKLFFYKYLRYDYARHFNCFIPFESFSNSLGLAIKLVNDDNKTRRMYQKNLQYPLLILVSLILGVYIFDLLVFPSLLDILQEFSSENDVALVLKLVLDSFCMGSLFILLIILSLFMVVKRHDMQVKSYCLIHRFIHHSIIDNFVCYDFVRYFAKCYEQGLSTKRILTIMKALDDKPLIAYISSVIDSRLSQGLLLEEAFKMEYIDQTLYRFMVLAVNTSSLNTILDSYLRLSEMKVANSCRRLSLIMQLSTYIIMTLVLIFIYQVLFLPLNVISSL